MLDLSLRNRLLNFKETKSTIRILSAAPDKVEDELAAQNELSLQPKPKLMSEDDPRNAITYTKQQRTDALNDHLRDELAHGRLRTGLEESEHSRLLTELYRAARVALDENGTNTLYAAVGILEWRETEHSDRVLHAPILLVPVELKRKSVLEGFTLRRIDEETRLNVTLMEMLRQNFQKEIPGLDPLPEDDSGVNVTRVFKLFRDAVRDLVGWEVKSEIWLGQFSFTKFLLWKDIADRLEDLTRNRIVNHLVHDAGTQYPNPSDDIKPPQLDDQFHLRDIYCPRSADSSQLAAVMAAAAGHDYVLEGPPGTGKSQTITNIIAHCLSQGKRVLFVAEKRAALDVVHRRLREDGLEPFCLELHSNKTGKADVLAQFDRTLKFISESTAPEWEQRTVELEKLRASLNDYTRALHRRRACSLSAHHCLDYLLPRQTEPTVRLDAWPSILDTPAGTLDVARQLSRLLQERSRPLIPLADHALAPLACEDWSPSWAERTLDRIRELGAVTQNRHRGDPKQLPPTNFFSSNSDDEDDRTPEEHKDLESILDELMTNGLRHKRLQWHYRSRHESLITFSNRQYYENELLTFPSPEAGLGGVRFKHLPEARYDKGKSRTNRGEAVALVDDLVARLRKTDGPIRSFGVVTFSQAQQKLVEDLLDQKRREHPEIEFHFGDEPPVEGEPVFVKNLESVQGDERDVILFSICYGPDEAGKVSMNFGPLNRDGGERRLNVAVTRAKHEVLVFSGLRADQIDLTRTRAKGVRDLKYFLDYADRGPRALTAANSTTGDAEPDSEFEKMVADRIRKAGYDVHHQVGCSGYRIDLAVVDPSAPGRYLLGIECDGATYHRAATARDRDKLRQMILEGLGWKLHRIWSTDWWHDANQEIDKLLSVLGTLSAGSAVKN